MPAAIGVISASALKRAYRDTLYTAHPAVRYVLIPAIFVVGISSLMGNGPLIADDGVRIDSQAQESQRLAGAGVECQRQPGAW